MCLSDSKAFIIRVDQMMMFVLEDHEVRVLNKLRIRFIISHFLYLYLQEAR